MNHIEKTRHRDVFHIHEATERYQRAGHPIDGYAEPTNAFSDFATALAAMLNDAGFRPAPQMTIDTP